MAKRALSEELLYCTTKIECFDKNKNKSSGTGYFYTVEDYSTGKLRCLYTIITNIHVVDGAEELFVYMTPKDNEGNPIDDDVHKIDLLSYGVILIPHPDKSVDLCMLVITNVLLDKYDKDKLEFYFTSLSKEDIPLKEEIDDLKGIENVVMVGYPIGIWDDKNNKPIVRSGITATHPKFNFQDKKEFVIDMACFPGSSGSPVFLFYEGTYSDKEGTTFAGTRIRLLGTLYGGPQYNANGEVIVVTVPTSTFSFSQTAIPTNLGFVINTERILELEEIALSLR
ncbi:S1 family peptidase [Myroides odoratimimus]|uniref:S1 family peptidase n=1 Tax=Myroides odoratimimus TaxID=76832 RepID=UPI003D2F74F1